MHRKGEHGDTRVVIADDSELMLETLGQVVAHVDGLHVTAMASDGPGLEAAVAEHEPDVVLMDLRLGDTWGFDLIPGLLRGDDPPAVVVLSAVADEQTEVEATAVGVFRQLRKGCPLEEIIEAISDAAAGRARRTAGA